MAAPLVSPTIEALRGRRQDAGPRQRDAGEVAAAREGGPRRLGRIAALLPFAEVAVAGHQQQPARAFHQVVLGGLGGEQAEDLRLEVALEIRPGLTGEAD